MTEHSTSSNKKFLFSFKDLTTIEVEGPTYAAAILKVEEYLLRPLKVGEVDRVEQIGVVDFQPVDGKAATEEPNFVLRGRDPSAPRVAMFWIMENIETATEEKLMKAFKQILDMRRYDYKKDPD